jgi:hypothetical protein
MPVNAGTPLPPVMHISGTFQLVLALYIFLTGSIPTVVQAAAFGLKGGAGDAFVIAMIARTAFDLLLIVPVLFLSRHQLGILHPLILAVVVWPLISTMPAVVRDLGGWAGVLAASPVETPYFRGLPGRPPSVIWLAMAKFDSIRILGLLCTYAGFFVTMGAPDLTRRPIPLRNPVSIRAVMIALIALSTFLLLFFVRSRGGINEHLTSLGAGRFRELSQFGIIIVAIQIGAIALWIWIAAMPSDIKSPLFLAAMAAVIAAAFISNGSRSAALSVPLTVGIIWSLRTHKIPWKIALLLIPVMFVAIGLLGAIRTSSWSGSTAGQEFAKAGWQKSFEKAQEEIASRQADSADVPVVERGQILTDGPLLGSSYAAAVVAFIPRPLWKNKPRGVGSLYARLFLGGSFEGATIPLTAETEMYWNFGIAGVVLMSFIYGLLLRAVYFFYWRRYPDPFAIVFYVLFITMFKFSSNVLVPFEQRTFLILLCYGIVAMFVAKISYPAQLLQGRQAPQPYPATRPS